MRTQGLTGISRYRWALLITAALVSTAVFSLPALVDVARNDAPSAAGLQSSLGYTAIAPISNVLDTLTLLTPTQYWATFALCAVAFLARAFPARHQLAEGHRGQAFEKAGGR